ncbi:DNA cytosine methyltransferase [Micromonospora chersina]|nr:DNA cytosine methyltransferase [Micromonospora chersina]
MVGPSFIDLFSGAGGLSWGLVQAGWKPLYAVDYWKDAIETYRANMPDHLAECRDVHELDAPRLARVLEEVPDWVVGGPPCQGYSTVGKRQRTDDRNQLFLQFRRIVAELKPSGFLLENVLGLKDMSFEEEVATAFRELGYSVQWFILTAAEHGVPQLRRRVVFVGHLERRFLGVTASHDPDTYVTVGEAIGDLPRLTAGQSATDYDREPENPYQKEMREDSVSLQGHAASKHPAYLVEAISHVPDGGNRRSIPDHLQPKSGFHNSYSRLASWAPAVAVTQNMGKPSGTRCIHPSQHRGLTTREGARLQSFPDRFHFLGVSTSQRLQVANAVPPRLGRALGEAIVDPLRWE